MEAFVALAESVVVCGITLVAAVIDERTRTIPDACPLAVVLVHAVAGLALVLCGMSPAEIARASLAGMLVPAVPLVVSALVTGGIGGGDIKLIAALGCALGWVRTLIVLLAACALTVPLGLVSYLLGRHAKMQSRFLATSVPMGPQIALSLIITLFLFPL